MTNPCGHNDYVRRVIALYRHLPGTLARPRAADRRLAAELHRRGVPLNTVETALLLAVARRSARPRDAPPLPPIRSLHYVLPIVDELLEHPPPDGYLDGLRARVAVHNPRNDLPAPVQKSTFLHER